MDQINKVNDYPNLMSSEFYLDQVKKCVTFIFEEKGNGIIPLGTGFFVGIQSQSDLHAVYFVTAKHVLQSAYVQGKVLLRMNTTKGNLEYIEIDLARHVILTHPDVNVDIAATLLYPPQDHFDYLYIPQAYFVDNIVLKEKNIREGSRAFFAGLFGKFYGKQRNYPVVRFGNISLITDEKIEVEPTKFSHLYLVECQSLGGFSGSPVFFEYGRVTREKVFFSPEIYLGGVMKGHYNDFFEVPGFARELNAGLALVTPCYLLKELLYTEAAKQDRENALSGSKNTSNM
ncbi:MAG: serine protease [Nitrososphaeraceae archaeon]